MEVFFIRQILDRIRGFFTGDVRDKEMVKSTISRIGRELNTLADKSPLLSNTDRHDMFSLTQQMAEILETDRTQLVTSSQPLFMIPADETGHFSELRIAKFRHLLNLPLTQFSRINLFAGKGNSGKTTILEAIQMMCSLNSAKDLIDLVRRRAQTASEKVEMQWFVNQIPNVELQGTFAGRAITFKLESQLTTVEDETFYLKTAAFDINVAGSVAGSCFASKTHFFDKYPQRTKGKTQALCPSVFSSPFSGLDPELLKTCHSISLKEGSKQTIIEFIQKHIDPHIQSIELNDHGRFTVVHETISPNPDLTMFGAGLQRIFKLGLLFAGAKNGVVIIDEFENAIHTALLPKLVHLIHELAIQFNVQVFLSSHSKECIDHFTLNESLTKDLSAYALVEKDGTFTAVHFSGKRMAELIDLIDFDIRGGESDERNLQ